jgi:hypothetical protein
MSTNHSIMSLGAAHMQHLRAQEGQTREEAADYLGQLYGALKFELGPDIQLVPQETHKTWAHFTMLLEYCPELSPETHAQELAHDLHRQIKGLNIKDKVDRVALQVQGGTVDWPSDMRRTVRACLFF